MKKILVSYQIPKEGLTRLFDKFHVCYPEKTFYTTSELIELIPEFDGLVSVFTKPVNQKIIEAGKKLRIIGNYGVGFNNIDKEAANSAKIVITNTPDVVTEPTAEMTFGLMLAVARRLSEMDRKLRQPQGLKWGIMENLGLGFSGKTLGIIGMGKIGKAVAKRALAFGMKVVYFSRTRLSLSEEEKYHASYFSMNELLKMSDFISLHTPLTPQTRHLIAEKEIKMMKKTAVLINTARGAVIDENALTKALADKKIYGAGLDVFEKEPEITKDLLALDNVVLAPHIGTGTVETRIEIGKMVSENIIAFFEGKTPPNIVNPEILS